MGYFLKEGWIMSLNTNVTKNFHDYIMPMISKKIHLKYIESAILAKKHWFTI